MSGRSAEGSLGFAIPPATAVNVVDQLLRSGRARHAYLGVQPATLTADIAQQLGVNRTEGVVVLTVPPDGPAAEAGLEQGDIMVGIDGTPTPALSDLYAALRRHQPGDRARQGGRMAACNWARGAAVGCGQAVVSAWSRDRQAELAGGRGHAVVVGDDPGQVSAE